MRKRDIPFRWHPDERPPQIEDHSKAKLDILRSYLRAYFDRLNSNPYREEFKLDLVDGFAGGGTFLDREKIVLGTPLIMLEEAEEASERLNQGRAKPLRFDCKYYFVDKETNHTEHLRKVLAERMHPIDDEKIVVINSLFQDVVGKIIEQILSRQPKAGRAIFLLDQTGFAQMPLEIIAQIFHALPAAEVILTFAADALTNHLSDRLSQIKAVAPLEFTDSQIRDLIAFRENGEKALAQRTLRDHIRALTGATYDTPFFLRPKGSRRALWFLHLSRHPTARDVMMQVHWKSSNRFEHYGSVGFGMLGWDALRSETLPLFHFGEMEFGELRNQLLSSMPRELFSVVSEEPITVDAMRHRFANRTAARYSDLDATVLALFREREFAILDPDGKARSPAVKRLKPTDWITLPATPLLPGFSRRR